MAGRESGPTMVAAYDVNTGKKHIIPEEWLSNPKMDHFSKTPKAKASGNATTKKD